MFFRKVYYAPQTGDVVGLITMEGDVRLTSFADDALMCDALMRYTEDEIGLLKWDVKDRAVEENFQKCSSFKVDVSAEPHQVVFDYTPATSSEAPDPAEMEAALNELGVQTRE